MSKKIICSNFTELSPFVVEQVVYIGSLQGDAALFIGPLNEDQL